MDKLERGDWVRVVFEAKINDTSNGGVTLTTDKDMYFYNIPLEYVTKIAPPVVVFEPGDRVRSRSGREFTIADNGYLSHGTNRVHESDDLSQFTSENFILVNPE